MSEPLLIIYSHSEYYDILHIATKFLINYKNKILLIDDKFENIEYKSEYKYIIKYDDKQPYASRLLNLDNIKEEIIIFMHETDILIKYNIDILNQLKDYILNNNIDKIELQHCAWPPANIPLKQTYNMKNQEISFNNLFNLYKINNPDFFVYNVNPTIWRTKTLLLIMKKFKEYNYRQIESMPVQQFTSLNFNCLSLKCHKYIKCGHFTCPEFFQFIHITHYGEFAQLKNKYYNNDHYKYLNDTYLLDKEIYNIYINEIYNPYIMKSKRKIRNQYPL